MWITVIEINSLFFRKSTSSRLNILDVPEWTSFYRMNMNMYKRRSLSTLTRQCFPFITGLLPCVLVNTESNSFDSKNSICKFVTFSGFIDCCVPVENPAPNIHLKTHSSIITFEEKKTHLISSNIPYVASVWRLLRAHSHRGWCLELCCFRFPSCVHTHTHTQVSMEMRMRLGWTGKAQCDVRCVNSESAFNI